MLRLARKQSIYSTWFCVILLSSLILTGVRAEEAKPAAPPADSAVTENPAAPAPAVQPPAEQPPQAPAKPKKQRPKFQPLRFDEDWSVLADEEVPSDYLDSLKYIPLTEDGEIWLSIGGSIRERFEYFSDFDFIEGRTRSDEYLLSRFMLNMDLHLTKYMRVFVEGKSSHSSDRELPGGKRATDVDTAEIQNAFIDLTLPFTDDASLTFRAGRQELAFGKQRLVGPGDWANARKHYEGFAAIFKYDTWKFHAFYVDPLVQDKYGWNEDSNTDKFYGLYASGKIIAKQDLDLYFFGLDRDRNVTFNGTTGDEARYTAGSRIGGKIGESGFDYDLEGAYQWGNLGAFDIHAWMLASQLGYTFGGVPMTPYWTIGLDYASGDQRPGEDVETFNQLFPSGHPYFGYIDEVGRQNIVDLSTGVTVTPHKIVKVKLDFHQFWRANDEDALYNAGGAVVRAGGLDSSHDIGQEIDLLVTCALPDNHTTLMFGYSHLFAGSFIDNSAPSEDIDFVYCGVTYMF